MGLFLVLTQWFNLHEVSSTPTNPSDQKYVLSKSTYIRGLQCKKSLFLYKKFIQLRDPLSSEQAAIFSRGTNIGLIAQGLFPGGTDARSFCKSSNEAIKKTQELINSGEEIIYEAAFQHDQVLVYLDILIKKDGKWFAYEVKSSVKVSKTYMNDAALQYFVITQNGLLLEAMNILYINKEYQRKKELQLEQFFLTKEVSDYCKGQTEDIQAKLVDLKEVIKLEAIPEISIGEHCNSPYPCDFMSYCWKNVPNDSVFNIMGANRSELFSMYNAGIKSIKDIENEEVYNREQRIQIWSYKNKKAFASKKGLNDFFDTLTYPIYFLDIEICMPALPEFEGNYPYQHTPYQYSLHYKQNADAELSHIDFLAESMGNPSRQFLDHFLAHIGNKGSILIFDDSAERRVLNQLVKEMPERKAEMDKVLNRFVDISQVFMKRHYYNPLMKGSLSLKNILPALLPGIDYSKLAISNGVTALAAFDKLRNPQADLFEIDELRKNLLEYCKMDTYAIAMITEKLREFI